jgi:hypothetical protein
MKGDYTALCAVVFFPRLSALRGLNTGDRVAKRRRPNKVIPLLQDLAAELPASEIEPQGCLALRLFDRLTSHLYKQVGSSDRKQLEADAVPNRHAAVHGLVTYKSFKNSLNTLFITDYAFQIVWAVKKQHLKSDG